MIGVMEPMDRIWCKKGAPVTSSYILPSNLRYSTFRYTSRYIISQLIPPSNFRTHLIYSPFQPSGNQTWQCELLLSMVVGRSSHHVWLPGGIPSRRSHHRTEWTPHWWATASKGKFRGSSWVWLWGKILRSSDTWKHMGYCGRPQEFFPEHGLLWRVNNPTESPSFSRHPFPTFESSKKCQKPSGPSRDGFW